MSTTYAGATVIRRWAEEPPRRGSSEIVENRFPELFDLMWLQLNENVLKSMDISGLEEQNAEASTD